MDKLKIGAIPFLNAKPITYGIKGGLGEGRFEVELHPPAVGAKLLSEGKLDLAITPTIEYARNEGLRIVPGISIATRGEVLSVLLLSDKPLEQIESIAVDDRSRTSVALLRILCAELYEIKPELVESEPDADSMLERCDAALLIGDTALYCRRKTQLRRDLGSDWRELTGQPFVFAFWAGREGAIGAAETELLMRSLQQGLMNIQKIAANYESPLGGSAELNERYLSEKLRYSLGDAELTGLKLFFIKAWEHGLIDGVPRLRFYEG